MTLTQWALEDAEALCLEHSFLMADPMGPLLDKNEEEVLSPSSSLEGKSPASPSPSFSSDASSMSSFQTLSPPPSPPASIDSFFETKVRVDSFPWLGASDQLTEVDDGNDDTFAGIDLMLDKTDLSLFDLDSLIGSCSPDGSLSSSEDLLASFSSNMELDLDSYDTVTPAAQENLESSQELVVKSEPLSPAPSSPLTQESESDMDVEMFATSLNATIVSDPSGNPSATSNIVVSPPTTVQLTVVVTNKDEPPMISLRESPIKSPPTSDCEDDSGIDSLPGSPPRIPSPPPTPSPSAGSSRTKPYSKPEPSNGSSPSAKASKVKSASGAPKVIEKKIKKMEQNKTAATRYRQKKRVEHEQLTVECEELEKRNQELAEKAESISREIQYLKDLMEEVRRRRNKTKPVA
ncbi:cyclic AMP-dependent transcription factor ATF-4 [Cynoglossus semilaevis]|nr:cyclic AMP-dependent transcription factor ATF-4-like [Cynoglossus semilaevis]